MKRFEIALSAPFKREKIMVFVDGKGTRYVAFTQLVEATNLKANRYIELLVDSAFKSKTGWIDIHKAVKVGAFCNIPAHQLGWSEIETEKARRQLLEGQRISDVEIPLSLKEKHASPEVIPAKKVRKAPAEKRQRSASPDVARAEPPRKSLSRSITPELGRVEPMVNDLPVFDIEKFKIDLAAQMGKSLADYCEHLRTYMALNWEDEKNKRTVALEVELRKTITAKIRRETEDRVRHEQELAAQKKRDDANNRFVIPMATAASVEAKKTTKSFFERLGEF